jgi:ribosomal protein L16 Arg81 hydroxylase
LLTFAQILGPDHVEEFLRETWGQNFAYFRGEGGRFHELLSWRDVNSMLQKHRLEPPRLRLVRSGAFANKSSYLRYEGGRVPFVIPERLSERLRDGYTLIIDAVDDMVDGVMDLAEDIERVVHESVQVNMYAGWREKQGFHRHCDTHDVVVLQVYGRKHWRIYSGGRAHPLKDDSAPNSEVPQELMWEGVLEDGDLLYIPRGWWHEASGLGEVTLHLTFGIHQRTGVNLMHWLADQMRESVEFRADLRRFGTAAEKKAQLQELRRQLVAAIDDNVLERFFADHDSRARSRGWPSLPWSVAMNDTPSPQSRVALDAPRQLVVRREGESILFRANGREWTLNAAAEPLLKVLQRGPSTVEELCQTKDMQLDRETVEKFISELASHGLIRVDGEPAT